MEWSEWTEEGECHSLYEEHSYHTYASSRTTRLWVDQEFEILGPKER